MLGNLNGWHLVIIVFVILLLFGAPKLPQLARSVGQSMKIFKSEVKSDSVDGADGTSTTTTDKPSTDSSSDDTKPSS